MRSTVTKANKVILIERKSKLDSLSNIPNDLGKIMALSSQEISLVGKKGSDICYLINQC